MIEPILLGILVISAGGMLLMFLRKMPVLASVSETVIAEPLINWRKIFGGLRSRFSLKKMTVSFEMFLHKLLSKIRVMTLKTESKTSSWLQTLRERAKKRNKFGEDDNYWQSLRERTKKK